MVKEFIIVTSGGDFINTKSPSLDDILAETCPQTLTLLLHTLHSPERQLSLAVIKEAALLEHEAEYRLFSLDGEESCKELMGSLPQLSNRDCWVVIEYCHLLPNCHKLLATIAKVCHDSVA